MDRATSHPIRVLYVGGSTEDRDRARTALNESMFVFAWTETNSAQELERTFLGEVPNVTLIDFGSSGYGGLDAFRALRAAWPETPLIAIVDSGFEEEALEAMRSGASECLSKTAAHYEYLAQVTARAVDQAREQSENRLLRQLIERSSDLIGITSSEHRVLYVNRAAANALGRPEEALRGCSVWDLFSSSVTTKLQKEILPSIERTGEWSGEVTINRRDGSELPLSTNVVGHREGNEWSFYSTIARDIAVRRSIELERDQLLHNLNERVKELTTLHIISKALNREGEPMEGVLLEVVNALPLGWQFPEMTASRIICNDLVLKTPNFSETAPHRLSREFSPGGTEHAGMVEVVYLRAPPLPPGQVFLPEELSLIDSVAGLLRSYWGRHLAMRQLQDERTRYQDLVENVPEATWTALANGKTTFVSANIKDMVGYTADELMSSDGMLWLNRVHDEDRVDVVNALQALFERGEEFDIEYRFQHRSGKWIWVHDRAIRTAEEHGVRIAYGIVSEVTVRKMTQTMLRLRERALESSVNAIIIARSGPEAAIEFVNPAFEKLTGYSRDEALGKDPTLLFELDPDQPGLVEIRSAVQQHREGSGVFCCKRKDGLVFWCDVRVAPVRNERGTVTHFIGIFSDLSDLVEYQQQVLYQATHDQLTGLVNRGTATAELRRMMSESQRTGARIAVAFIDLDNFRDLNDTLGHKFGDQALRLLSEKLRAALRKSDVLARVGGDEFLIVVMEGGENDSALYSLLNRLQSSACGRVDVDGHRADIRCSVGVSMFPVDSQDAETLIKFADIAMYRAKEAGRDNIQFFTDEMNQKVHERVRLGDALKMAIAKEEFALHFQPQVSLETGEVEGLESLIRWNHPEYGVIGPDRFIPLAEATGLIVQIGAWALHEACTQAQKWRQLGCRDFRVSVNLSAKQLNRKDLVEVVERALAESGFPARLLELELTETMLMEDPDAVIETLRDLTALGVCLAIDDFGTGFSSLSYLKRMPVDHLKIDKSFVSDVDSNPEDAHIARSVISLGHSLGLRVIAEGVETPEQLEFLRSHNCDEMQGYLYSRPLPAEEVGNLLKEGRKMDVLCGFVKKGGERTLLLVDDEENVLRSLVRLLRRDGYNILTANSGEEGLSILAQHRVGVILSDQRMPGMSGVEFLSRVKELYPETVRVVLSGYTELKSVTDAINRGGINKFLTKPWDDNLLRAYLSEAFRRYEISLEKERLERELNRVIHELSRSAGAARGRIIEAQAGQGSAGPR